MKVKNNKTRALVLFSGGLDSILAVKILEKQGIEVTGLTLVSYFFNSQLAETAAKKLKIELKIVDVSDEHLAMVKKPVYGYGKNMNPCLDCRILMFKEAKKIKADLIASGEILGERPLSQNKSALKLIAQESGLAGRLVRPLSAKLLEPTLVEKQGLVQRNKLLDISGRSRKKQISLAGKWGIQDYPNPAGGCLLTDPYFSQRLKELFQKWPDCQGNDVQLLKLGRHFWLKDNKIIVGRNQEENETIKKLARRGDVLISPNDFPGPTVLIRGHQKILEESLLKAKELVEKYSKH